MNLGDIITRVQRQLGDESEVEVTKADITRWANDAQVDIVRKTECLFQHAETSTVAGDGIYVLPDDFIAIKRVTLENNRLEPTSAQNADNTWPDRDSASSGTPSSYFVTGKLINLYPAPSSAGTLVLDIYYVRAPMALINPEDIPEIPIYMHEDIVRYCVAIGKELDEETNESQRIRQDYETRVAESRHEAQHAQADSYPSIRLCPGDDW